MHRKKRRVQKGGKFYETIKGFIGLRFWSKHNVDADIHAVSDSEIPEYIDKVDVIMLGPHVKYLEEELKKKAAVYGVPVACISQQAYGILDGKRALSETIKLYKASKAGEQQ